MIIFENSGEIDPQLITLIGVNVKESESAIGYFGTGLKYAIACISRWGEMILIQSGLAEFNFTCEKSTIRGREFGVLVMNGQVDSLRLGFTTDLGKNWEPWMVYRELWCNAYDESKPVVYEADRAPKAKEGLTRVIVMGSLIEKAHLDRAQFILQKDRKLLHSPTGLEIYEGEGNRIFYRGIAVQKLEKSSCYTYNITEKLYLTEDRTAGAWQTDLIIARGLAEIEDQKLIDQTLAAPTDKYESRLDYDYVQSPGEVWRDRAAHFVASRPMEVHASVRRKFTEQVVKVCPTCKRPM